MQTKAYRKGVAGPEMFFLVNGCTAELTDDGGSTPKSRGDPTEKLIESTYTNNNTVHWVHSKSTQFVGSTCTLTTKIFLQMTR